MDRLHGWLKATCGAELGEQGVLKASECSPSGTMLNAEVLQTCAEAWVWREAVWRAQDLWLLVLALAQRVLSLLPQFLSVRWEESSWPDSNPPAELGEEKSLSERLLMSFGFSVAAAHHAREPSLVSWQRGRGGGSVCFPPTPETLSTESALGWDGTDLQQRGGRNSPWAAAQHGWKHPETGHVSLRLLGRRSLDACGLGALECARGFPGGTGLTGCSRCPVTRGCCLCRVCSQRGEVPRVTVLSFG